MVEMTEIGPNGAFERTLDVLPRKGSRRSRLRRGYGGQAGDAASAELSRQ